MAINFGLWTLIDQGEENIPWRLDLSQTSAAYYVSAVEFF